MTNYDKLFTRAWAKKMAMRKFVETGVPHKIVCVAPKLWHTRPARTTA